MPFTNTPIMTCDQLLAYVQRIVGNTDEADLVEDAVTTTLIDYGTQLMSTFYITFAINGGVCELVLGAYGINNVTQVEQSCGDGCWMPVKWWRTQDNRILFDGRNPVGSVRITYQEAPAMIPGQWNVSSEWDFGDPELHVTDVAVTQPIFQLPTSGYVWVEGSGGTWLEYRGVRMELTSLGSNGMYLLGCQAPSFVSDSAGSPISIGPGSTIRFGIPFPMAGQLSAVAKQSAAYYWATKTGTCNNEDDRSVATQLLNFWTGEAENAWKAMLKQGQRKAVLLRNSPLLREPIQWQFL